MDKAGRVFVNFHPALDERHVVGTGERKGDFLIGNVRRDDAHVHAPLRRHHERLAHSVIYDQIGRGNIHVSFRPVQKVDVNVLSDLPCVHGAGSVAVGLHIALPLEAFVPLGDIGGKVLRAPPLHIVER